MNTKRFIIFLATAVISVGLVSFGYWRGKRDERKAAVRFNLASSLHLYAVATDGTPQKLKSDLGFLVYISTQNYLKYIGETSVPADFRDQLAEAQRISKQVETNLVVIKP
jgi:hypothetical protein